MPPVRKKKSSPNGVPKAKAVSRKERRKREREAKKQRKVSYNSRFSTRQLQDPVVKEKSSGASSSIPSVPNPKAAKKRTINHVSPVAEKDRKEIRKLEKLLNVKKKDKLPKSFASDGLDCILFSQFLSLPLYFPHVLLNDAKNFVVTAKIHLIIFLFA